MLEFGLYLATGVSTIKVTSCLRLPTRIRFQYQGPAMNALCSIRMIATLGLWVVAWSLPGQLQAAPPIDFNRQIRPILSENCFACHGPDAKQRKAKLRLDTK